MFIVAVQLTHLAGHKSGQIDAAPNQQNLSLLKSSRIEGSSPRYFWYRVPSVYLGNYSRLLLSHRANLFQVAWLLHSDTPATCQRSRPPDFSTVAPHATEPGHQAPQQWRHMPKSQATRLLNSDSPATCQRTRPPDSSAVACLQMPEIQATRLLNGDIPPHAREPNSLAFSLSRTTQELSALAGNQSRLGLTGSMVHLQLQKFQKKNTL